ncbi:MAG: hypothetical protein IT424_12325 [Pirellulales bacterium]|nr:hypothetical protein [Pirellulales bacterium]
MRRILLLGAMALPLIALPAQAQYVSGIDVSRWQGDINWTAVKNAGIEFAFCKATEGVDFIDVKFTRNMTLASAAGVYIGPYHFGRINSNVSNPNDAVDEAHDFVDAIAPYYQSPGNFLRPVLDVENTPGFGSTAQNRAYVSEWVRDFVGVLQDRLGFAPIIYCNTSYAGAYFELDLAQYDLWIANYADAPPAIPPASIDGIWDGWDFWQYTDSGSVAGVAGNVDRDVYQGTLDELLEKFLAVPPAPDPTADFDQDGEVDGLDFLTWQQNYGLTAGATLALGDANFDERIDAADLTAWSADFAGGRAVSAVPEPTSFMAAVVMKLTTLTVISKQKRG